MNKLSTALIAGLAVVSMSAMAWAGKDLDAIKTRGQLVCGVMEGTCDVYTNDSTSLYATRAANPPPPLTPDDFVILPEIISKEPLAPAFRQGDNQFGDIVRWIQYAMIETEEYGITSENVDEMLKSDNPSIRRILGVSPGMGKSLGVDEKWVYNIVKQVGNYGEAFDRNLGMGSPLKIERGLNKLWTQGGLQYAPPIR